MQPENRVRVPSSQALPWCRFLVSDPVCGGHAQSWGGRGLVWESSIQMAEMSFLIRVVMLSLKIGLGLRGSIVWGRAQIRVDDQHQDSAEVVQAPDASD